MLFKVLPKLIYKIKNLYGFCQPERKLQNDNELIFYKQTFTQERNVLITPEAVNFS